MIQKYNEGTALLARMDACLYLSAIGKIGGQSKSKAKQEAARENGKRPKRQRKILPTTLLVISCIFRSM
jgi:hypothetical protein